MYNVSPVPCNSFNGKSIFKYIYLPILVQTKQLRSTICSNTLLAEININFEFLKYIMHRPYVFFFLLLESFSLYQQNNVFLAFVKKEISKRQQFFISKPQQNMRSYIIFVSNLHQKIHQKTLIYRPFKSGQKKYIEPMQIFCSWKLHRTKYVETTSFFCSLKLPRRKYVEMTSIFRSSKLH